MHHPAMVRLLRKIMSRKELEKVKKQIEKNMHKAAAELNFEEAAVLRDKMIEVNKFLYETK